MLACTEQLRWELQFFVMIHSTFWTEFSFLSCSFIINRWLSFYNCIHSSMETTPTCLHVQNIYDENFNLLLRFTLPFRRSSHFFPIHSSSINDFRFTIVHILAWKERLHACMYRTFTRRTSIFCYDLLRLLNWILISFLFIHHQSMTFVLQSYTL